MPVTVSYPGVYIEEIPSGVRTITGVATSIAAFAGWAPKGPTDQSALVLSWADYDRQFGGLDNRSYLGYAVYHFFANGGQQAYIIRLVSNADTASVTLNGRLKLSAKNPGEWAKHYAISTKKRADDNTRFRLSVVFVKPDKSEVPVESFEDLSMNKSDQRFVEAIVNSRSGLVTAQVVASATQPPDDTGSTSTALDTDVKGTDGTVLVPNDGNFEDALLPVSQTGGVYLLDRVDLFNLLCVPGESTAAKQNPLEQFCKDRRAFYIADCARDDNFTALKSGPNTQLTGDAATNAAFYFPWLLAGDPLQQGSPRAFPPCGFVAGVYARTDSTRGVWKAPAGTDASVTGASDVAVSLTDGENGVLNLQAVNCIRNFKVYGTVVWGARTLQGNDERGSEWKYVPVRRIALFLEESLYRGTKWVVFEPNDEPLWAQIRLNVGAFLHSLFRQGAFAGKTPHDAYFVKCDKETTTQDDVNRGVVNILVGFAPLKPAEFVIIQIQQMAGQIQV
jgi:phage tail sheath protein FI